MTCDLQVSRLEKAIESGLENHVVIMKNYKKDGNTFWNRIQTTPFMDKNGHISLNIWIHYEVCYSYKSW